MFERFANRESMSKKITETAKGTIRLDLEQRSFYRFSLLATQINRSVANAYVQKFGRPVHGWKVITLLGRYGPLTASQINGHTTLEMDKVTRIVDSLVTQGVATRDQDKADRRRVIVSLTAKGKRINSQIEQMIGTMEREFLIVLAAKERELFYDLLDRLQGRANQIFTVKQDWNLLK
ncbi:MAG: MarR family transcriptional regulator [Hyphomicrobiales bacterium]|jgi:DNA-binding MarR family transcriptional regulator|nr:MarR family transcriptional regulator [Hyphomicrobiales bacterium]